MRAAYLESVLKQDCVWHDTESSIGKIIQVRLGR